MSAELLRNSGSGEQIHPQKSKGRFSGFFRRLFIALSEQQSSQQLTPKITEASSQPISPILGEPIDITLEIKAIVDGRLRDEQEAIRKQEEEKSRREEGLKLKGEENARRFEEWKNSILEQNKISREIREKSGVFEFFSQAYSGLIPHYQGILVEGWRSKEEPGFALKDSFYSEPKPLKFGMYPEKQTYCIRLAWRTDTNRNIPVNIEYGEYNYIEAICDGGDKTLTVMIGDERSFCSEKVFEENEWYDQERIKQATINGVKSPIHHSARTPYTPSSSGGISDYESHEPWSNQRYHGG